MVDSDDVARLPRLVTKAMLQREKGRKEKGRRKRGEKTEGR